MGKFDVFTEHDKIVRSSVLGSRNKLIFSLKLNVMSEFHSSVTDCAVYSPSRACCHRGKNPGGKSLLPDALQAGSV